jgi:thioesterase domain-containing protein
MDANPSLIQPGPVGQSSRTPLVLIHDGSGLVSSYYWLGSLGRKVYGVHNPHFDSASGNWEGGLHEMAKAYVPLVKSVVHHGKVLLGGTSPFGAHAGYAGANLFRLVPWRACSA